MPNEKLDFIRKILELIAAPDNENIRYKHAQTLKMSEQKFHLVGKDVSFEFLDGKGVLYTDKDKKQIILKDGDEFTQEIIEYLVKFYNKILRSEFNQLHSELVFKNDVFKFKVVDAQQGDNTVKALSIEVEEGSSEVYFYQSKQGDLENILTKHAALINYRQSFILNALQEGDVLVVNEASFDEKNKPMIDFIQVLAQKCKIYFEGEMSPEKMAVLQGVCKDSLLRQVENKEADNVVILGEFNLKNMYQVAQEIEFDRKELDNLKPALFAKRGDAANVVGAGEPSSRPKTPTYKGLQEKFSGLSLGGDGESEA